MRKRKRDAIRSVNRMLDRMINRYGKAVAPRRQPKGKSFFDIFMDESPARHGGGESF